jgi:hypothetical protein
MRAQVIEYLCVQLRCSIDEAEQVAVIGGFVPDTTATVAQRITPNADRAGLFRPGLVGVAS